MQRQIGEESGAESGTEAADRSRRERLGRVFSVRGFLLALAVAVAGLLLGGLVPLLGSVGRFAGLFLGAFALGAAGSRRRYVEVGAAGALAAGLGFLGSSLGAALLPIVADYGVEIAGVGAGTGLLVSLAGHYFGRDLRAGITREM